MVKTAVKLGLAKLYVCLSGAWTAWQLFQVPFGQGAAFTAVMFTIFVAAGLVDAVVNDLLPDRYFSLPTRRYRYVIFIALGGAQMSLVYGDVLSNSVDLDTMRYAFDTAVAVGVAVLGLWSQHRAAARKHGAHLVESSVP